MNALEKHWHPDHFFCSQCGRHFPPGQGFMEKDGKAYCEEDYFNMFAPKVVLDLRTFLIHSAPLAISQSCRKLSQRLASHSTPSVSSALNQAVKSYWQIQDPSLNTMGKHTVKFTTMLNAVVCVLHVKNLLLVDV